MVNGNDEFLLGGSCGLGPWKIPEPSYALEWKFCECQCAAIGKGRQFRLSSHNCKEPALDEQQGRETKEALSFIISLEANLHFLDLLWHRTGVIYFFPEKWQDDEMNVPCLVL